MFSVTCNIVVTDSSCNSQLLRSSYVHDVLAFRRRSTSASKLPPEEDPSPITAAAPLSDLHNLPPATHLQTLMPAQTILSKEEKAKVTSAIPKGSNKIWIASLARIYYAYPNPNEWSYAGLQGGLAFAKNSQGALLFKLVDLDGTRGVIWEHELYQNFDYFQDRPYFHSFPGDVRLSSVALMHRR